MNDQDNNYTRQPHFFNLIFAFSCVITCALLPILLRFHLSFGSIMIVWVALFILSSIYCYFWLFVMKHTVGEYATYWAILLATLHPAIFGFEHWDILQKSSSAKSIKVTDWLDLVSLNYGVAVLTITTIASYFSALSKSPTKSLNDIAFLNLRFAHVNLKNETYQLKMGLHVWLSLQVPLAFAGLVYLAWFSLRHAQHPYLSSSLKILGCSMVIAFIVCYMAGILFGEAIRLFQIKRRLNMGTLYLSDQAGLLRWRHDYVKYHLPAPIRKLNLRLFNQHVTAYENYLRCCMGAQEKNGKR